jgi:hypothetical protein
MEKGKRKEVEGSSTQDDYVVNFTRDNFQRNNKRMKADQERSKRVLTKHSLSSHQHALSDLRANNVISIP